MMTGVEKVIPIHKGNNLQEDGPFQYLAQNWQDGNRPVDFRVDFSSLTFVQWDNFSNFSFVWKLVRPNGQVDNVAHRWHNPFPGYFQNVSVYVVNP